VIQNPSVAGFIIPHMLLQFISEGMPLVVEQVSSVMYCMSLFSAIKT